jgi:hypothetical protein
MDLKLKHADIDDFIGAPVTKLREINADAEAIKAAVQTELKRQAEEALEALKESGYAGSTIAASTTAPGKKRGRRTKAELAAAGVQEGDESAEEVDGDDLVQLDAE